ncbi:hypothetical protein BX600DRAFT_439993 [Xylariales sp. PMI_506]|nr:hypothetical protein BX600DRAFT_439993 [Xylariales sp. PMI_506]
MLKKPRYQQVSPTAADEKSPECFEAPESRPPPPLLSTRMMMAAWFVAVVVSIAAGFIAGLCMVAIPSGTSGPSIPGSPSGQPPSLSPLSPVSLPIQELEALSIQECGETPAEAREIGCKFDPMLQQWIPVDCYDEEQSESFLRKGKWKWYYDVDRQLEMPDDVMRLGLHEVVFMNDDFHRRHCAYSWEIQTRAMQEQRPLLEELLSYKHVHHCNTLLLMPKPKSKNGSRPLGVETHAGYGRCALYKRWLHDMPE